MHCGGESSPFPFLQKCVFVVCMYVFLGVFVFLNFFHFSGILCDCLNGYMIIIFREGPRGRNHTHIILSAPPRSVT